jgi:hypothetical protein
MSVALATVGCLMWLYAASTCVFLMGGPCHRCYISATNIACRIPILAAYLGIVLIIMGPIVFALGWRNKKKDSGQTPSL